VTLTDIDRFQKLCTKAEHPGTPKEEAASAAKMAAQMEVTHPGIRKKAQLVQQVVDAEGAEATPPRNTGAGNGPDASGGWGAFVSGVLKQAVQASVNAVADDVTGTKRYDKLGKGEVVLTRRDCAEGQVCIEVRARSAEVIRSRSRAEILDSIEDALLKLAEG
jgi:hypothetical protein